MLLTVSGARIMIINQATKDKFFLVVGWLAILTFTIWFWSTFIGWLL